MVNPFETLLDRLENIENFLKSNPANSEPQYLLIDSAADFISSTPNAIRVMVSKKQIPHIKKQGKLFFLKSDLIDWLESGRIVA